VSGQSKLEIHPAIGREFAIAFERSTFSTEIDEGCGNVLNICIVKDGLRLHVHAAVTTPLAFHQGPCGAETARRTFVGNGLVEDEVDAFTEELAYIVVTVNNGNRDWGRSGGAPFLQEAEGVLVVFAIDHDYVEAYMRETFLGSRGGRAVFDD
jgi:hypothetical protein